MQLVRTTVRLPKALKKEAEKQAIEDELSFQNLLIDALTAHLERRAQKRAKKFFIPSFDLGKPLNNLTRDDFYE